MSPEPTAESGRGPKGLRELDPDSYTTITVCLPCAGGECYVCYGEGCECLCAGEVAGSPVPGGSA